MPRPKKEAGVEPKKRSRTGCWPCKARKVKCGEEKPICTNCSKSGEQCDYSIRLNWAGRSRKDRDGTPMEGDGFTFVGAPSSTPRLNKGHSNGHEHIFSSQHLTSGPSRPVSSSQPAFMPTPEPTPNTEGNALDPQLRLTRQTSQNEYPLNHYAVQPGASLHPPWQISPPMTDRSPPTSAPLTHDPRLSPGHSAKRVKLSSPPSAQLNAGFAIPQYPMPVEPSSHSNHYSSHSIFSVVNTPATPGSTISSGSPFPQYQPPMHYHDPPDLRRLSVKSLLSEPSDEPDRSRWTMMETHGGWRTHGYDHGFEDLDVPNNDDSNAIHPRSPDLRRASTAVSEASNSSSNEVDGKLIAFEPGGYYAQPVPIKLPRSLEPLPAELTENQMNLLYFHHFINHTARILVPHDCSENPLRGVLPLMAVRNTHLLHLLLAFSASHRARLLGHPEPERRIAAWMDDVLPALRQALAEPSSPGPPDPTDPSSLAPLATAIMLASLEIIRPNTFAVSIPWQQHLHTARQMIIAKGGLDHLAQQADGARDKAFFLISRWFAYLDVLGSLSGGMQEQPLDGAYLEDGGGLWLVNRDPNEEIYQIDCFFGFSGRCISLLAQVAELAAQCDKERIDPFTNSVRVDWAPPEEIRQQAEELQRRLIESATGRYRGCTHSTKPPSLQHSMSGESPASSSFTSVPRQDEEEIFATNALFHWAALIHLSKRVLNLPPTSSEVQSSVQKVLASLQQVRNGSSAESNLLFPLFTAGCEAQGSEVREMFVRRLKGVEGWGMEQFARARELMERVWETGGAWETMVRGEFFG